MSENDRDDCCYSYAKLANKMTPEKSVLKEITSIGKFFPFFLFFVDH